MKKTDNYRIENLRARRRKKFLKRRSKGRISYRNPGEEIKYIQKRLPAPDNFSFVENTNEMLQFFEEGRSLTKTGMPLKFDLRYIKKLTSDGIAIFASIFTDKQYFGSARVSGTSPKDPKLKKMFFGSGFFNHVASSAKPKTKDHNFLLHKVSNKKVEPSVAKLATDFASKYTFKNKTKFRPVYEIIIELMANTNNHASPLGGGYYDWWLYVFYDEVTNVTSYSFLDFGVGIFKSKQFINYYNLLIVKFQLEKTPLEMANDLLDGKISSRTGLEERGRGFTCITQNASNTAFKKFIIVTNNLMIDIKNRSSTLLSSDFNGTFAYWEISNEA